MVMMGIGECVLHRSLVRPLNAQIPDPQTGLWACVAEVELRSKWVCTGTGRENGGRTYSRWGKNNTRVLSGDLVMGGDRVSGACQVKNAFLTVVP